MLSRTRGVAMNRGSRRGDSLGELASQVFVSLTLRMRRSLCTAWIGMLYIIESDH